MSVYRRTAGSTKNVAVYGASGSMKTRAYCINRILQAAAQGESLIICDPKSELYETTSQYLRDEKGYLVRVLNLYSLSIRFMGLPFRDRGRRVNGTGLL